MSERVGIVPPRPPERRPPRTSGKDDHVIHISPEPPHVPGRAFSLHDSSKDPEERATAHLAGGERGPVAKAARPLGDVRRDSREIP